MINTTSRFSRMIGTALVAGAAAGDSDDHHRTDYDDNATSNGIHHDYFDAARHN